MSKRLFMRAPLAAVIVLLALPARAATSDRAASPEAAVRLVTAYHVAPREPELMAGLHFTTKPGWHVYWKNSGDAGYAPSADWSLSSGVHGYTWLWPAPSRFALRGGLEAFGYEGEVVYPIIFKLTEAAQVAGRAVLEADVDYLVCADECVPYRPHVKLEQALGEHVKVDKVTAPLLERFVAALPVAAADAGVTLTTALAPRPQGAFAVTTRLDAAAAQDAKKLDVFFAEIKGYAISKPAIAASGDGKRVTFETLLTPKVLGDSPLPIVADFVITHVRHDGRERAVGDKQTLTAPSPPDGIRVELMAPAPPSVIAPPAGKAAAPGAAFNQPPARADLATTPRLPLLLLFAFLGGLILNVMPCVLPVLSLKLIGLVKLNRASGAAPNDGGEITRASLISAAGIFASFALLAVAVAAARAAGHFVGWGVQFQEPIFVAALAVVVVFFTLNLWGLFELALPGAAAQVAAGGPREGALAHFLSGFFATLLATPCSAPFLGTAIAFALAAPGAVVFVIFMTVAAGFALPYFVIALAPGALRWLPRPGAWMETVRLVMGFLLAASCVWLLYVLAGQVSAVGVAWVQILLLTIGLLLALKARAPGLKHALNASLLLAAIATPFVAERYRHGSTPNASETGITWQAFDQDKLKALTRAGTPVFVDVTADWCFTCKANELTVLAAPPVAAGFKAAGVVAMRADWTRRDAAIGNYLASYGRYGIPFYIYYPPGAEPVLLPELLSENLVLTAIAARSPQP